MNKNNIIDLTEILARRILTKTSKISLTSTSRDLHGQDLRQLSFQTDPKLLSQLPIQLPTHIPFIKGEETAEISQRKTLMKKSKVWQTPWLIDLTGQDPKSHSFQMAHR